MTFLLPWAFAFLALVPVIVLLYLLKERRRSITVSTLMFWQELLEQNKRRALFQRLRHLLSLLLHLLIFLLILFALSRPELKRQLLRGGSSVLVLDGRARMQALEGGPSRFDKARDFASNYARHANSFNQIAIVFAHAVPEVVSPFSADDAALRARIADLHATDAGGDLQPALDLARELLKSRKGVSRIVLFTAGQYGDIGGDVERVDTGSPQDNVAITRFAVRSLPASPRTAEVLLEIRNFSRVKATGNTEIRLDGTLLDVRPFAIDAGDTLRTSFSIAPETAASTKGWLTARLDRSDALMVDNLAFAALPAFEPARVLLVSAGDWFLENLLKADDLITFDLLSPDAFKPAMARAFDVVILDRYLPPGLDPERVSGNFLFLGKSPFKTAEHPIEQPLITDTDPASPLLRLVNLKNVVFLRATPVPPSPDAGPWSVSEPIKSFDSPLILTGERKAEANRFQRFAVFGFDTGDSDLPLRVAFPLLMSNTIRWLAGGVEALPRAATAGETVDLAPGEELFPEPVPDPAAERKEESPWVAGTFLPLRNGFYSVRQRGRSAWLAVNTFSDTESDLRASGAPPPSPTRPSALRNPQSSVSLWPIWFYLALAALILFTLEWFLYHRRKTE